MLNGFYAGKKELELQAHALVMLEACENVILENFELLEND